MLTSVSSVNKMIERDSQRQNVYSFDKVLSSYLINNKIDYSKLYGDLPRSATILELSKKVANDFGCISAKFSVEEGIKTSYCQMHSVTYEHSQAIDESFIETMLHEIAHLFSHMLFNNYGNGHGGHFVCILRMLFVHYELITEEYFNELLLNNSMTVKLYDDYIANSLDITKEEFEDTKENSATSFRYGNDFIHFQIESDEQKEYFIHCGRTNRYIKHTCNKFGYEMKKSRFENMTKEELRNVRILSPVTKISYDGYKTTSNYCYDIGFFCFEIIENGYQHRYSADDEYEIFNNHKEARENLSLCAKNKREEGFKVVRTYSWQSFTDLKDELHLAFRNLQD